MDSYIDKIMPKALLTNKETVNCLTALALRGVRTRTITEITLDNLPYIKEFIKKSHDLGVAHNNEFRHLDTVVGNFSISDEEIYQSHLLGDLDLNIPDSILTARGTSNSSSNSRPQSIVSSQTSFVQQQQYIFNMLWEKSMPADQKIKLLEKGIQSNVIDIIPDPRHMQQIAMDLISNAKSEILIMFSTINSLKRQRQLGFFTLLNRVSSNTNIRILLSIPNDLPESRKSENIINNLYSELEPKINIQLVPKLQFSTSINLLIIDKETVLINEILDDTKNDCIDASGL